MIAGVAPLEDLARAGAGALIDGVIYGVPVVAAAWAVTCALRRANAATRYCVWFAALVAVICLGPLPGHPLWRGAPAAVRPLSVDGFLASRTTFGPPAPGSAVRTPSAATDGGAAAPASLPGTQAQSAALRAPLITVPATWALWSFAAWYVIAGVLAARLVFGLFALQRIKRSGIGLPDGRQTRLAALAAATGCRRNPRLLESLEVDTPIAIGLMHPAIVMPAGLPDSLTADEFDQICLHELAHIARRDDWTNLIQKFAEALLFFSPSVHIIGAQLSVEREIACDDLVVTATGRARTYASCLTRLAEITAARRCPALPALGANLARKQIFVRIERLLDRTRIVRPQAATGVAWMAAAVLLTVPVCAAQMSPLVAVSAVSAAVPAAPGHLRAASSGGVHAPSGIAWLGPRTAAATHAAPAHGQTPARRVGTATRASAVRCPRAAKRAAPIPMDVRQVASATITDATSAVSNDPVNAAVSALAAAPGEEEKLSAIAALAPLASQARVRLALVRALLQSTDEPVQLAAIAALSAQVASPEVARAFVHVLLQTHDEPIGLNVVAALGDDTADADVVGALAATLNSNRAEPLRLNALAVLTPIANRPSVLRAIVLAARSGPSEAVRINAVAALAPHAAQPAVHAALVDLLEAAVSDAVRANVRAALGMSSAATQVAATRAVAVSLVDQPEPASSGRGPAGEPMRLSGALSAGGTLDLDNVNGDVRIDGYAGTTVEVEARTDGADRDAASVSGNFDGTSARVHSVLRRGDWSDVSVDYVIRVPAQTHVIARTVNGNIEIRGVAGAVEAHSTSGDVQVDGAGGAVEAASVSGSVRASGLTGDSSLTSTSGDVVASFLRLRNPQNVRLATTSGDVTITVPRDASAHFAAKTMAGDISTALQLPIRRGTIGATIDAVSGSGMAAIVELAALSGSIVIKTGP